MYNTRRTSGPQSAFAVGRRRPVPNNFNQGGQLNGNQQQQQHQQPQQHQQQQFHQQNRQSANQSRNQQQAHPSDNHVKQQNVKPSSAAAQNVQVKKEPVEKIPDSGTATPTKTLASTQLTKPTQNQNTKAPSPAKVTSASSSSSNPSTPTVVKASPAAVATAAVASSVPPTAAPVTCQVKVENKVTGAQSTVKGAVPVPVKTEQQVPVPKAVAVLATAAATTGPATDNTPSGSSMDTSDDKTEGSEGEVGKKTWFKNRGTLSGRITKAEKLRRRNLRLSKILQPKSAVMILNELVRGTNYNVEECTGSREMENQFKACVQVDGQDFVGIGRTKMQARNEAAEVALKFIIKTKHLQKIRTPNEEAMDEGQEDEDVEMEIQEDESKSLPWSHIASFAMFKLLTSWGEDPNIIHKSTTDSLPSKDSVPKLSNANMNSGDGGGVGVGGPRIEPKPAKKMPASPEKLNPLMLIHQMLPNVSWEEGERLGMPPNSIFTFKLHVSGRTFSGSGSNKKTAKKMAAFAACHELLYVNYPPDVWTAQY